MPAFAGMTRTKQTLHPAFKLALDQMHKHLDPALAVIEAGNVAEPLTTMFEEDLLVLLGDLLERLVGIGLDPLCTAEARLKCELELGAKWPERSAQGLHGLDALLLVGVASVDISLRQA